MSNSETFDAKEFRKTQIDKMSKFYKRLITNCKNPEEKRETYRAMLAWHSAVVENFRNATKKVIN